MERQLWSIVSALILLAVSAMTAAAEVPVSPAAPAAQPPAAQAAGGQSPAPDLLPQSAVPDAEPTKPITGAFGLRLGERFDPEMVALVLAAEPHSYRRWDKTEQQGTRYRVEPYERSACFQTYEVLTNQDGIIYAIRGDHEDAEKQSACKTVTIIADELKAKYGRPRGQGSFNEIWFSFRDLAANPSRSLRLYGHRCKGGRYTILYSDEELERGKRPPKAEAATEGQAGAASPQPPAVVRGRPGAARTTAPSDED